MKIIFNTFNTINMFILHTLHSYLADQGNYYLIILAGATVRSPAVQDDP